MTTHPATVALAAAGHRFNGLPTDQREAQVPSDPWIVALHLSACRRWLAKDPPAPDEAARTLELLRSVAVRDGATSTGDHHPAGDRDTHVAEMRREVDDLAALLLDRG